MPVEASRLPPDARRRAFPARLTAPTLSRHAIASREAGGSPEERVDPHTRTAAEPAIPRHRRLAGPLLALLTVLTWSTYSIASSLAAAQGFRPWDMTLLRFAGGALLVLPFLPRRRIADLDGLGWRRGAGLALAGGPLFGLVVYSAFALAPLAHATVFPPSCVMVTGMVLSALLLGERPGPYQLGGGSLLLLGLLALAYDGLAGGGRLTWLGDLLFALAGCSWGVFTFLLRRWRGRPCAPWRRSPSRPRSPSCRRGS